MLHIPSRFLPFPYSIHILQRLAMWILWNSRGFDPVCSKSSFYGELSENLLLTPAYFLVAFRLPRQLSSLGGVRKCWVSKTAQAEGGIYTMGFHCFSSQKGWEVHLVKNMDSPVCSVRACGGMRRQMVWEVSAGLAMEGWACAGRLTK